jgi:hypothetical protein
MSSESNIVVQASLLQPVIKQSRRGKQIIVDQPRNSLKNFNQLLTQMYYGIPDFSYLILRSN